MIENNQNTENNSQGLKVNLDALSAPEGNYDPVLFPADNAGDSENPPGDDGIPENLPNLDEELSNQNQELDQNNSQDQIVDNTSTQSDAQDHSGLASLSCSKRLILSGRSRKVLMKKTIQMFFRRY